MTNLKYYATDYSDCDVICALDYTSAREAADNVFGRGTKLVEVDANYQWAHECAVLFAEGAYDVYHS